MGDAKYLIWMNHHLLSVEETSGPALLVSEDGDGFRCLQGGEASTLLVQDDYVVRGIDFPCEGVSGEVGVAEGVVVGTDGATGSADEGGIR